MKYKLHTYVFLAIFLLILGGKGGAVENNPLEFLWEIDAPRSSVAVGEYSLPVICNDLLYMEEHGGKNNKLNVYDLKTGNIIGSIDNPAIFNMIGPITNGDEVIYVNEVTNSITKLNKATPIWQKKYKSKIWEVAIDKKNIYINLTNELVFLDIDGEVKKSIINNDGSSILIDDKNIYLLGEYLYKINKNTAEIKYKLNYKDHGIYYLIRQNNKYLFGNNGDIILKETGDIVKNIEDKVDMMYFGVSDKYIVSCEKDKLIVLDAINFNKILEKKINDYYTFEPIIQDDLLYIFLDRFVIIDLKTGDVLWEDKDRDDFIEYIPQIIVTDKYIGIYVEKGEDSVVRIYKSKLEY
ncbi:MAG: hypothetical protein ACOCRO_04330 [Halanaerobiales bacterium]